VVAVLRWYSNRGLQNYVELLACIVIKPFFSGHAMQFVASFLCKEVTGMVCVGFCNNNLVIFEFVLT
jgi:hypothetical protein